MLFGVIVRRLAEMRGAVAREDPERVLDVRRVDRVALLEEAVELLEHAAGELRVDRIARDGERALADVDPHVERALEEVHVLVVLSEERPEVFRAREPERRRQRGGLDHRP